MEKIFLAEDEQYETTIAGKKKKVRTVGLLINGLLSLFLQAESYKTNSQPYYVILDHNENQLGDVMVGDKLIIKIYFYGEVDLKTKFSTWLQEGNR